MIINIPDPDVASAKLKPITDLAYSGLEYGTLKARVYFQEQQIGFDPYAASMLTRLHAKRYLEAQCKAFGLEVVFAKIPNIGIRLSFMGYSVWIMKAYEDEVPPPGWSSVKERFYNQLPLPFPGVQVIGGNMILLWEATKNYQLLGLTLVCPKTVGDARDSFESHWEVPLQHPAESINSQTAQLSGDADANTLDDLDEIQPKKKDKAEGEDDTDD